MGYLGICAVRIASPVAVVGELTACDCAVPTIDIEAVSVVGDKRTVPDQTTSACPLDSVPPIVVYAAIEQGQLPVGEDPSSAVVADLTVRDLQDGSRVAANGVVVITRRAVGLLNHAVRDRQFGPCPIQDDGLGVVGINPARKSHRAIGHRTPGISSIEVDVEPVSPGAAARAVLVRVTSEVIVVVRCEDDRIRHSTV